MSLAKYNFDEVCDRVNSDSLKWNLYAKDVLPMFVADMDFRTCPEIITSLNERLAHGCFGYTTATKEALDTVQNLLIEKYNWPVEREAIIFLPGLVSALCMAARMGKRQKTELIIPTPCYPPFVKSAVKMGCNYKTISLIREEASGWRFPNEILHEKYGYSRNILALCNPQNPTGHMMTTEELDAISNWATTTDSIVLSDEIHAELIIDKSCRHIPVATRNKDIENRTITLMSPSKTFNLAGIGIAFAVIPNPELRKLFIREGEEIVPKPSAFGYAALISAYQSGEPWKAQLLEYLRENCDLVIKRLEPYKDLIRIDPPQATYMAWLDFTATGWQLPAYELIKRAKVALGEGKDFSLPKFARLTFACPKSLLNQGLDRICGVLEELGCN